MGSGGAAEAERGRGGKYKRRGPAVSGEPEAGRNSKKRWKLSTQKDEHSIRACWQWGRHGWPAARRRNQNCQPKGAGHLVRHRCSRGTRLRRRRAATRRQRRRHPGGGMMRRHAACLVLARHSIRTRHLYQCWAHSMLFRSMPSCTISHSGDISRSCTQVWGWEQNAMFQLHLPAGANDPTSHTAAASPPAALWCGLGHAQHTLFTCCTVSSTAA